MLDRDADSAHLAESGSNTVGATAQQDRSVERRAAKSAEEATASLLTGLWILLVPLAVGAYAWWSTGAFMKGLSLGGVALVCCALMTAYGAEVMARIPEKRRAADAARAASIAGGVLIVVVGAAVFAALRDGEGGTQTVFVIVLMSLIGIVVGFGLGGLAAGGFLFVRIAQLFPEMVACLAAGVAAAAGAGLALDSFYWSIVGIPVAFLTGWGVADTIAGRPADDRLSGPV